MYSPLGELRMGEREMQKIYMNYNRKMCMFMIQSRDRGTGGSILPLKRRVRMDKDG